MVEVFGDPRGGGGEPIRLILQRLSHSMREDKLVSIIVKEYLVVTQSHTKIGMMTRAVAS